MKWKGHLKSDAPRFKFLPWSLLAEPPWECSAKKMKRVIITSSSSCEEYRTQVTKLNRLGSKMQFPFPFPTINSYNNAGGVKV